MERSPDQPPPTYDSSREPTTPYRPILSQHIEAITRVPYTPSSTPPSVLKALFRLTGATSSKEVGTHGPAQAAATSEQNAHIAELGLYQEVYPRDAHVTAQLLWPTHPELTKATVRACLPYTGATNTLANNSYIDEQEIGKIPHQIRDPDHPRSRHQFELRTRGYPFYGAIDTTQKNILGIARVSLAEPPDSLLFLNEPYRDTHGETHTVLDGLRANLDWVLERTGMNNEGLVESLHVNPRHHANQSWADSPDSFHHSDGYLAEHHPEYGWGVASVEVNAETYDALQAGVRVYTAMRARASSDEQVVLDDRIIALTNASSRLKASLHTHFWVDDPHRHGGYFARGTDRDKHGTLRPLAVRSSDMGHLLLSDVLEPDDPKVQSVIANLFSPELLAPNGVRTLASDEVRYHEHAYHNGTVWPWDTYVTALGLEKHGYHGLARELEQRIIHFYEHTNTLAEFGGGGDQRVNMTHQVTVFDPALYPEPLDQYSRYTIIQPPQEIQAWTVAAVLAIKYKTTQRARDPQRHPIQATDTQKRAFEYTILDTL